MPRPTTAQLTTTVPFPDDPGEPLWSERRTVPVGALYGVPLAFLVVLSIAVGPWWARGLFVAAAAAIAVLLVRARRRSLIETFAVSERYLSVVQPDGGRVAVPVDAIRSVTLQGDQVQVEASSGVITLGFVRRQRALVAVLRRVCPSAAVDRQMDAFCRT